MHVVLGSNRNLCAEVKVIGKQIDRKKCSAKKEY